MARTTRTKALTAAAGPQVFRIPHLYEPRSYERPVLVAYERGFRRFLLRWHRRAGKDLTSLALTQRAMADRPGLYMHIYPTAVLGRSALWQARDREGVPFLDRFPAAWRDGDPNNTEMLMRLKPLPGQPAGSMWKVAGADDPDALRGLNPVGVVLSEFSEHDPRLWDEVLPPIFAENDGWVLFNFTPKGKNHAHAVEQVALANPDRWFLSVQTVEQTRRDALGEDGSRVVPAAVIAQERADGKPEEIIQQEYFVSYDGYLEGTIYGDLLRAARREGRIDRIGYDVNLPVGCCLDIGRSDGTAGWFYQIAARETRFIDYFACRGKGADYIVHRLKEGKPYLYGKIGLPHDAVIKGFTATESTEDFFRSRFACPVVLADKIAVQQGLDAVRREFRLFAFDAVKCDLAQEDGMPSGLESLGNYHRAKSLATGQADGAPVHDRHSHGADALRTGVVAGLGPLDFYGHGAADWPRTVKAPAVLMGGRR